MEPLPARGLKSGHSNKNAQNICMLKWDFAYTFEFGEIPKILWQAEQAGKLGRQKILNIIFLYLNTGIYNLYHMLENT